MSKARDIADGAANINLLDDVTAGTVAASKVIAADSNKDVASFRNVTLTGELDAATLDVSGNADIDGVLETDGLSINGTSVTATAAELNILDGVTSTTAELNILDGVTATAAELNILDGVTSTTAELNYSDGVTSNIQTQLDAKQALDANLTSFVSAFTLPTSDGSNGQVLTTNGSGTLSLADAGGGGAYDLFSATTVSSSVSQIDLSLSSSHDNYMVVLDNLADTGAVYLRWKRGGSFITSGEYNYSEAKTSFYSRSSQSRFKIGGFVDNNHASAVIYLFNINETHGFNPSVFSQAVETNSQVVIAGNNSDNVSGAVTDIRFYFDNSITSGKVLIYNLKTS